MSNDIEKMISDIQGTYLVEAIFANDGGHFDFDREKRKQPYILQTPVFCEVYARCKIRLSSKEDRFSAIFPLEISEQQKARSALIEGQRVERAGIDPDNNSLRVLFENGILLSIFPTEENDNGGAWVFYCQELIGQKHIVFWKGKVETESDEPQPQLRPAHARR